MSDPENPPDPEAELERVRAERDELQAEVEALEHPRQGKVRGFFVGLLVVITCIAMLASVVGLWARQTALDDEAFDNSVTPLASDPRVQAALSAWITNEVMVTIDPETIFKDSLPDQAQILAVPLSSVVETFVGDQVDRFLASDAFARLWAESTSAAHVAAVDLIEGDKGVVGTDGDTLVINMVPIINGVLAQIGEASPEIFGKTVDIPTVTVDDVPKEAIKKLEDALGITLPGDYGVIRVDDAGGALSISREVLELVNFVVLFSVVLTVVCLGLVLWISHRRRRTILQLVGGLIITFVLFRRIGWQLEDDALELVKIDVNRGAADAVLSAFVDPLIEGTTVILWLLAIIGAVALISGPYPWAIDLRARSRQLARAAVSVAGSARERAAQEETAEWVRRNLTVLQIAGGVVAFVLLVWFSLSFFWLVVLMALIGLYEYLLWRIEQEADNGTDGDDGGAGEDPQPTADTTGVSP